MINRDHEVVLLFINARTNSCVNETETDTALLNSVILFNPFRELHDRSSFFSANELRISITSAAVTNTIQREAVNIKCIARRPLNQPFLTPLHRALAWQQLGVRLVLQ